MNHPALTQQYISLSISLEVVGEFSNLFNKFRTCFVGSQRIRNKLNEMRTLKSLGDSDNRKLKSWIYEMERKEESHNEQIEDLKLQVVRRDREKVLLQQEIGDIKEEVRRVEKRLENQVRTKSLLLWNIGSDRL